MMEPLVAPGRYCYEPVFCLCGAIEHVRAVQVNVVCWRDDEAEDRVDYHLS